MFGSRRSSLSRRIVGALALGALAAFGLGASAGRAVATAAAAAPSAALRIPVLVPLTGFLSAEGTSQRDGAALALQTAGRRDGVAYDVADTGDTPENAVNALQRALGEPDVVAIVASMLGTQMLAMIPIDDTVPMLTVSGTAKITELGNPNVFRFFPSDRVVKVAQARYVVEQLHKRRPAILYQTTAYGQSGNPILVETFKKLGADVVLDDPVDVTTKDLLPEIDKVRQAKADVLVLQLHAGSTALVVRQAASAGLRLPIVAGSAMHQPSTAALLAPAELKGVCAETASSPVSSETPRVAAFTAAYRKAFHLEPDAFALGQYDGTMMALDAIAAGARTPAALREKLSTETYRGVAMTYKDDGKGNMAHSAEIICYDGTSRIPRVVKRYENVDVANVDLTR